MLNVITGSEPEKGWNKTKVIQYALRKNYVYMWRHLKVSIKIISCAKQWNYRWTSKFHFLILWLEKIWERKLLWVIELCSFLFSVTGTILWPRLSVHSFLAGSLCPATEMLCIMRMGPAPKAPNQIPRISQKTGVRPITSWMLLKIAFLQSKVKVAGNLRCEGTSALLHHHTQLNQRQDISV